MNSEIISIENISLNEDVKDWREAIKSAGNLLVNSKNIKTSYVECMIKTVEDLGPYIVIVPHVAIAHSRPDDSVIKESISMVTLKSPVKFGHTDNDPVDIVFALAAKDSNNHLNALVGLSKILESKDLLDSIRNCENKEKAYNILNNF